MLQFTQNSTAPHANNVNNVTLKEILNCWSKLLFAVVIKTKMVHSEVRRRHMARSQQQYDSTNARMLLMTNVVSDGNISPYLEKAVLMYKIEQRKAMYHQCC